MAYSEAIVNSVKEYLSTNNHEYDFDGETGYFVVREDINLDSRKIEGLYFLQLLDDCILFRYITAISVGARKLNAVAEYINRVNDCLINGCLVLDYDEGKISYKGYIGSYNDQVTEDQLTDSFASCELAFEAFGENLVQVAEGQIKDIKALFEN